MINKDNVAEAMKLVDAEYGSKDIWTGYEHECAILYRDALRECLPYLIASSDWTTAQTGAQFESFDKFIKEIKTMLGDK